MTTWETVKQAFSHQQLQEVTANTPVHNGPAVGRWTQLSARTWKSSASSFHLDILYWNMLVPGIHSDLKITLQ